jgi:Phage integrase family
MESTMTEHVAAPSTSRRPLPEVPGIDLSFRPRSYFWPLGLETHLLARVKGAERKAALTRLIDARRLDEIPDFLAQSALSEAERKAIGRIHPAFMGGEYLPDLDLPRGTLHVNRKKSGDAATHPMSGRELRALRQLKRTYPESPFLFVTERGGPITEATVRKIVARAGQDARIGLPIHPHMLRHYVASRTM